MVGKDKKSEGISYSEDDLENFRLELNEKLLHLNTNIEAEVALMKPIHVKKIQDYEEILQNFQSDLIILKQRLDNVIDIERVISLKADILSLEKAVHTLMTSQELKNTSSASDYKVRMIFLRIRSRAISVKIKKDHLSYELNNMNLAFVYGLKSLIQKDTYIQARPELLELTFVPRGLLGKKAAFVLMRVRAKYLISNMTYKTEANIIKDKFVEAFHKINNNVANSDAVRLQKLKNFVKFAHLAKEKGESLKAEDIIAKIKAQSA